MGSVVSAQRTVPRLSDAPLWSVPGRLLPRVRRPRVPPHEGPRTLHRPHARYETTAIAMSLYERGEFADPYAIPPGHAHVPPLYPLC